LVASHTELVMLVRTTRALVRARSIICSTDPGFSLSRSR